MNPQNYSYHILNVMRLPISPSTLLYNLNYTTVICLLSFFLPESVNMSFIKTSTSYEYLYSPKSWLHLQDDKIKISLTLVQLICLPFASLKFIFILFIFSLCLQRSIKMPKYLKRYFHKILMLFTILVIMSVKNGKQFRQHQFNNSQLLQIYPLDYLTKNIAVVSQAGHSSFYLQISILRFLSIYLAYLTSVRCLLLTTKQENFVRTVLSKQSIRNYANMRFIFVTMTSSQFLRMIFKQMKRIRVSYSLRCMTVSQSIISFVSIALIFFLEELLISLNHSIQSIAYTLHNRDIK